LPDGGVYLDEVLHGQHERIFFVSVEEFNLDSHHALQLRRPHPVHAVNHPHRGPMHKDWRQGPFDLR
jgi:hypothetical protein